MSQIVDVQDRERTIPSYLFRLFCYSGYVNSQILNLMYNQFMARIQMILKFVNFKKFSYLLPFS